MPREKPAYRDSLEYILERSGGKALLNQSEVAAIYGVDRRRVRTVPFNELGYITAPSLARYMSKEG